LSWLATKVAGSAGGVRAVVAAGMGVSVGTAVPVGCSCANAVSKAWVSAALRSGVGADGEAGWQEVRKRVRRKTLAPYASAGESGVRCEKRG
jgi:hypothetical protein